VGGTEEDGKPRKKGDEARCSPRVRRLKIARRKKTHSRGEMGKGTPGSQKRGKREGPFWRSGGTLMGAVKRSANGEGGRKCRTKKKTSW